MTTYFELLKTGNQILQSKNFYESENIFKECFFLDHKYYVSPGVFIPRIETEEIVLNAKRMIKAEILKNKKISIIEVGFGTGIISIELALAFPMINIYAWDISKKAYKTAKKNSQSYKTKNIYFYNQDFFKDQNIWNEIFSF